MIRSISFLVLLCCLTGILSAQHLSKEFHKQRREEVRQKLPPHSVAVFLSGSLKNRSNDIDYPFHTNPDFYYLSGYKEPDSYLLIFSEPVLYNGEKTNEIIFVRPKDATQELWNGNRLGTEGVKETLGFANVYDNSTFSPEVINKTSVSNVLLTEPIKVGGLNEGITQLSSWKLQRIMDQLRETKHPIEIQMIKRAIEVSCIGQIETMKALNPNMTEMEAQGIHEFVFKKYGCQEVGYPSIVGAGNNSCVLHYIENDQDLQDGELLLMDVGAEYEGYTADITRTIPVNGSFSKEQKILYNIVKRAQEAGFEKCVVGNNFYDPHIAATEVITKELRKLGIAKSEEEVKQYFPHGTSHYLGLDVHDRGTNGAFKPNTIITVEPGIYIPEGSPCPKKWWGIGIRIEDDILITSDGWENLSQNAPRSVDEIEKLMKSESPLNQFNLPILKKPQAK